MGSLGGLFNFQQVMISIEKQKPTSRYAAIYGLVTRYTRYSLIEDGKIIIDGQINGNEYGGVTPIIWITSPYEIIAVKAKYIDDQLWK
ncbi:hypothetical protein ABW19_dt0200811 [Dactylella cylindrospora]|nr:hypothetical protein ABW19_dt0200811 [Dactylella cylindrospora]